MSAGWFVAAGLALVLAGFGFRRLLARAGAEIRATGYTPLAELFGGQVGDDSLAMVADDKPKVMRSHGFTETSPGVWEATFEDEIEAVVLAIDVERERMSLGIKQMAGDPFTNFAATHEKGSLVTGKVKSVDAKGAVIDLGGDVEGYLRASEISSDRVEDARNHLKEGDSVTVLIINVDRKNRSLNLSIKAKDSAEASEAIERMKAEATTGTTNLGALLKAKLDNR